MTDREKDRTAAAGQQPVLVSGSDIGLAIGLPLLYLTALATPASAWPGLARAVAPLGGGLLGRSPAAIAARIRAITGDTALARSPEEIGRDLVACEVLRNFFLMGDHIGRWRPEIELRGAEHVTAGLDAGKGVVLWDSHFYFASIVTKVALHRAGFGVSHLSHPRHGFSETVFGMRFLNPVRTSVEGRYVDERVVMSLQGPVAAMRTLLKRLRRNRVVSITVRHTAREPCAVPFFEGQLKVATGAPDIALTGGAPLLPVFSVRRDDGGFLVTVEPPIDLGGGGDRREAARSAAGELARRLETHVRAHPGQWGDWINI